MDTAVFSDIDGHIFGAVGGFFEKHFENKAWSSAAERVVQQVNNDEAGGKWTEYPAGATRQAQLKWLLAFQSRYIRGGRVVFRSCAGEPPQAVASGHDPTPDLYMLPSKNDASQVGCDWRHVQVLSEIGPGAAAGYQQGLMRLCRSAQEAFKAQPARRFLHGFYMRGSWAELWVFSRLCAYSCEPFDVTTERDRFVTVLAGYAMMSDEELGKTISVKQDGWGSYTAVRGYNGTHGRRLYLEDPAITSSRHIINRGPACYRARLAGSGAWELVVKFAWRPEDVRSEEQLLRIVTEKKIQGVNHLFGLEELDRASNLHRGLSFGKPRRLHSPAAHAVLPDVASSSGGGVEHQSVEHQIVEHHGIEHHGIEHHSSEASPEAHPLVEQVFEAVVVRPFGRRLDGYRSVVELLTALRDAIKAHRALYTEARILHQDISGNNILIVEGGRDREAKGLLIDLDMALELDAGPADPHQLIGTRAFMAIGLMEGKEHTYRHDLESFLYVLLWVAICHEDKPPESSRLQRWVSGRFVDCARSKVHDMGEDGFADIMAEVPDKLEGIQKLAGELRRALFSAGDGSVFTGTDLSEGGADALYSKMLEAFDEAIKENKGA